MTREDERHAHPARPYALGQLRRALEGAASLPDRDARERALGKVERWRAVLDGMASGGLAIGSRTPVADTPAWVTLEVSHGGFATGHYLAETRPDDAERHLLSTFARDVPGTTERERINLWYLSDEGQRSLLGLLASGKYEIDLPEQAALLVTAWLVAHGHFEVALDTVAELRPLMHRLRFSPRPTNRPPGEPGLVHVATAGEVAGALRSKQTPVQVAAMRESLRRWTPLFDDLVELWCSTVVGELPHLAPSSQSPATVEGGWPCRSFP